MTTYPSTFLLKNTFTTASDILSRVSSFDKNKKITSEYIIYFNDLPIENIDMDSYIAKIESFVETTCVKDNVIILRPQEVVVSTKKRRETLGLYSEKNIDIVKIVNYCIDAAIHNLKTFKKIDKQIIAMVPKHNLYLTRHIGKNTFFDNALYLEFNKKQYHDINEAIAVKEDAKNKLISTYKLKKDNGKANTK